MSRYKGRVRLTQSSDFPHVVETVVPKGGLGNSYADENNRLCKHEKPVDNEVK